MKNTSAALRLVTILQNHPQLTSGSGLKDGLDERRLTLGSVRNELNNRWSWESIKGLIVLIVIIFLVIMFLVANADDPIGGIINLIGGASSDNWTHY